MQSGNLTETAVLETFEPRKGRGREIVVGEFKTLKPLLVLDLSKMPPVPSYYDKEKREHWDPASAQSTIDEPMWRPASPDQTEQTAMDVKPSDPDGSWTTSQKLLVFGTTLAMMANGVANRANVMVGTRLIWESGLWSQEFAARLGLWESIGTPIGGAAGGFLGDRFGRRATLLGCLAFSGVLIALGAAAISASSFVIVVRLLGGIAFGAAIPSAVAFAAEFVPGPRQALAASLTVTGLALGGLVGSTVLILIPLGWRPVPVLIGIFILVVVALLFRILSGSPRGERYPALSTLDPALSRDRLVTLASFSLTFVAVAAATKELGSLSSESGVSSTVAQAVVTVGASVCVLVAAAAVGRFGSRVVMLALIAGGGVVAGGVALLASRPFPAIPLLACAALLVAARTTMYALVAHLCPTGARATGVGIALACGGFGSLVPGLVAAPVSRDLYWCIAALTLVLFVGIAIIRRHIPPATA